MVTRRRRPRPLYIREWREFMGTKAIDLAIALDIERESYYRLERHPHKFNNEEMDIIAAEMGVKPSQFWFPPPTPGQDRISLDDLMDGVPDDMRKMVVNAVKGMMGK